MRAKDINSISNIERAARLIYLNKTCYNRLYRVNSKGQFNVPFGRYKNPRIVNEEAILKASKYLKSVSLKCISFEKIEKFVEKGDFIYFDPPYYPISKTAYFTSYTKDL